jgi:purine-nucleoside phosphorylase
VVAELTKMEITEAARFVRARISFEPEVGLVLGSGLSLLADEVTSPIRIPYGEIPHSARATVLGHRGQLVLGHLAGRWVCVMNGRFHYYEGLTMQQVTFPIRVMKAMGVSTLVVTNAAGGLNPVFQPGDLMCIRDHINLLGMAGLSPLIGPNDESLGPRFPDMSRAYNPELRRVAREVATAEGIPFHEGVYVGVAGPSYETSADLRYLRLIGADAVGMSTVPEVTVARHAGMAVLGISGISNLALGGTDSDHETSHEEVLAAASMLGPRFSALIRGVLPRLGKCEEHACV